MPVGSSYHLLHGHPNSLHLQVLHISNHPVWGL